jgi:metal-responsive CopG/Arc/MetJ family transcriptional regulator
LVVEMARAKYATVKIPVALASKLDICCKNWGYRSRAEMVDDAIRFFVASMNGESSGGGRQPSGPTPAPAV